MMPSRVAHQIRRLHWRDSMNHIRCLSSSKQNETPHFYSYSSGRSRRRRRKEARLPQQPEVEQGDDYAKDYTTERQSIREILFHNPYRDMAPPNSQQIHWPKDWDTTKKVARMSTRLYFESWNGFLTSKTLLVKDKKEEEENGTMSSEEWVESIQKTKDKVQANVQKNTAELAADAKNIRDFVRKETGINSSDDIKRIAEEYMRLAVECLNEFTAGYKQGRDEQMEKVVSTFFENLEKEAEEKQKKRTKKRRVIRAY